MDRLRQAVKHVRTQRSRAFKEPAQYLRRNAGLRRKVTNKPTAAMNGPTQMAAERVFAFGFHHSFVPLAEFRQLLGNERAISPQSLQQF